MELLPENWAEVWAIQTPLLELLARGAVLYAAIVLLLRVFPRRTGGELAANWRRWTSCSSCW